jgi:hypothetical protein
MSVAERANFTRATAHAIPTKRKPFALSTPTQP